MRTEGIKVKLTIPIRFDQPDLNGVVHSKEAINKAFSELNQHPLIFRTDEDDNPKCIGHIDDHFQMIDWDNKNGVCTVTMNGIVYYGGMGIVVNECHKDETGTMVIDDFTVSSVGFSL